MPPKQNQWNNTVPPYHTVQSMSFNNMYDNNMYDDFFSQYGSTPGMSDRVFLEKEGEMKIAAGESSQTRNNHAPPEVLDYPSNSTYNNQTCNIMGYFDQTPENQAESSSIRSIDSSFLQSPEYQYNGVESKSVVSSPSFDPVPISPSSSVPVSQEMSLSSNFMIKPSSKKYKSALQRTLSYESVMELGAPQKSSPTPDEPLDHDKVMEALRAKLKKSASPKPKQTTEPAPHPNTYPTTGVLFLDIKNRRRKPGSSS
ncbi:hypothetical protein G6F56_005909 [Rhizopus delemar]|nr:hypothetical protein G6F56_005909 [Rhizopus delemar]